MHPAPMTLLLLPIITTIATFIPPQNHTQSHHLQILPNSTLTPSNPTLTYHIPKTPTTLYVNYFPFFLIPLTDLTTAINNIRARMAQHIQSTGDGWLLPRDDPLIERLPSSDEGEWEILIQSSPVTVHLTYGVVLEVMDGMESLIKGPVVGSCQMFAAIQDAKKGQVGRLRMFRSGGADEDRELVVV